MRNIALFCVFALLTTACAGGPSVPAGKCPEPANFMTDYVIGPGDILQIVVWRNEELSTTLPVRPDGKITTPLIDDMQAAGRSPSELGMAMEAMLSDYIRTPEVSVIVTEQGISNQIQIVGEVAVPQAVAYRSNLRVLDVIVASGGLTDFAAGNRTRVVRPAADGQIECAIKVKRLIAGDMSQNIELFPGDVLVVPEARF